MIADYSKSRAAGFTLIELSIVLVIIGLIVGGVLVGQSLIKAAEIQSVVSQYQKYNAAANTFKLKYNCMAGDCATAADVGFDATTNGNGDGFVGSCSQNSLPCSYDACGNSCRAEYANFWYHLNAAGLIGDAIQPASTDLTFNLAPGSYSPRVRIVSPDYGLASGWTVVADVQILYPDGHIEAWPTHSFALYGGDTGEPVKTPVNGLGSFSAADIYAIDAKIDDGLPFSGIAHAYTYAENTTPGIGSVFALAGWTIGAGGASAAVCVRNDTTPPQYNIQYTDTANAGLCNLVIKGSF